jgi:hypothetical protein
MEWRGSMEMKMETLEEALLRALGLEAPRPAKAPESPPLPISRAPSLAAIEAKRKALREAEMRIKGPLEIFGRRI